MKKKKMGTELGKLEHMHKASRRSCHIKGFELSVVIS